MQGFVHFYGEKLLVAKKPGPQAGPGVSAGVKSTREGGRWKFSRDSHNPCHKLNDKNVWTYRVAGVAGWLTLEPAQIEDQQQHVALLRTNSNTL